MPHRILLSLMALPLPPAALLGQAPAVPPGARVRVRHPCGLAEVSRNCTPLIGRALRPIGDGLLKTSGPLLRVWPGADRTTVVLTAPF